MKNLLVLGLTVGLGLSAAAIGPVHFHEIARYNLGGDGGWDYLNIDSASHRIFIARSNRVMVVDSESGKIIREIPKMSGIHGVALDTVSGFGFASLGESSSVAVFDLKSYETVALIPAGTKPDAILYDAFSKRVFTFNGSSNDVTVIDAAAKKMVGRVELGASPEFAVSDGAGKIYVNLKDTNSLARFDALTLKLENKFALAPCTAPTGLSMDAAAKRLFVGCGNKLLLVVNGDSGKVMQSFPAGSGIDATAFDPQRKLAFASAGEGQLTVIREKSANDFELVETVPTQKGARTMALDPQTGRVFLVTAKFGPRPMYVTAAGPAKPSIISDSFTLLELGSP